MSNPARRRILNDFKNYQKEAAGLGVLIKPLPENMMVFEAIIIGPDDTEWEGGIFKLMIEFGQKFPSEPPKVHFLTQMFHPNIYTNGQICLDILDKAWTPLYDCTLILTQIQSLLTDPNPDSPANSEAAQLFVQHQALIQNQSGGSSSLYNQSTSEYVQRVRECVFNSWIN